MLDVGCGTGQCGLFNGGFEILIQTGSSSSLRCLFFASLKILRVNFRGKQIRQRFRCGIQDDDQEIIRVLVELR